jgi:hypothetical protein
MKDRDNYDYLRGFVDGEGNELDDSLPVGFNSIHDVRNRALELIHEFTHGKKESSESKHLEKTTIVDVKIKGTAVPHIQVCVLTLSDGQEIDFACRYPEKENDGK